MFKKNLIFLIISSFIFPAIYSVGDIVSLSHQNQPFDVCYGEHPEDNLKLVHFNGAENGGVYKVMLIDISATWCGPCVQFIPDFDAIDNNWADNDGVEIFNALGDMNQPYSCTQWGNMGIPNIPMIAHDAQNNIFSWFNTGNAIPSTVFIDHEMRVHYMSNQVSYSQANNIIQSMLDNCTMCGNPDYDNDFVLNEEDNCPNDFNPNQGDQDMDQIGDTCDDCHNLSGDPNDDMFVTVTDIILVVSMISNGGYDSPSHTECQKSDGNFNNDSVINVLDIIQMINIILGNTVSTNSLSTEGIANIDISNYNNKLTLTFSSKEDILGIQIKSNLNTSSAKLIDNSEKEFITNNNMILSYSLNNSPFKNNFKIEIDNPDRSEVSDFDFIISDKGGNSMNLVFSENGNIYSESDFKFELGNTYPNPFNPTTDINFSLPMDGNVSLDAYNLQGQKIENIFSGYQIKGSHNYTWDASHLTSGIYYIKLVSGVHQATTRTILMK
tara:strand:+ start:573 stop:2060 length:1488 start_codon:yes stop_codon:yes gene_type:complete